MKKIGIMTMHRIRNYGSFMQAYALKKNIEDLGYSCVFIDYNYEKSLIEKKKNKLISLLKKVFRNINIFKYINTHIVINKFEKMYSESLKKYLNVDYKKIDGYKDIDELVIGSDEVFNCLQSYPVGYSRELFGMNYEHIPVISYAASFGNTTMERLNKYGVSNEIGKLFSDFSSISVRDENSFKIVNQLVKKNININLDPVLITDFENEIVDNVNYSNYILVYAYINRINKEEKKIIKSFAKKYNKKIITLGGYQDFADINIVAKPFEIWAYFKHADFVITDTFHGTIFSVKMHANFATIIRNGNFGNNNKLMDLMDRIKVNERILNNLEDIEDIYKTEFNYTITDEIINKEIQKSSDYLKSNLIK